MQGCILSLFNLKTLVNKSTLYDYTGYINCIRIIRSIYKNTKFEQGIAEQY